jgi:hypothetical protein
LRESFDVLHERRTTTHAALGRTRRNQRRLGRASGKPGYERRFLADDKTVRRCGDLEPDAVKTAAGALRNCARQRAPLTYRSLADRHDDVVRTDGSGGERSSVEHQVRHATE